jgi:hypothetical protein
MNSQELKQFALHDYQAYLQTDHWRQLRRDALKYYGESCLLCGRKTGINIHHRHYNSLGCEGIHDLTVLCKTCHEKFHDVLPGSPLKQKPVSELKKHVRMEVTKPGNYLVKLSSVEYDEGPNFLFKNQVVEGEFSGKRCDLFVFSSKNDKNEVIARLLGTLRQLGVDLEGKTDIEPMMDSVVEKTYRFKIVEHRKYGLLPAYTAYSLA